jgi:hypothetical protein
MVVEVAFPISYCETALAVPTVKFVEFTYPTGRFCALETGLQFEPPFVLIWKDTFAFAMLPGQALVSLIVALSVNVAVLLVELVVQAYSEPV